MQVPSELELDIVRQQLTLSLRATSAAEHNRWVSVMDALLYRLHTAVHAILRRSAQAGEHASGGARTQRQQRRSSRGGAQHLVQSTSAKTDIETDVRFTLLPPPGNGDRLLLRPAS
jgi:hypothetical protein